MLQEVFFSSKIKVDHINITIDIVTSYLNQIFQQINFMN